MMRQGASPEQVRDVTRQCEEMTELDLSGLDEWERENWHSIIWRAVEDAIAGKANPIWGDGPSPPVLSDL
jgi:hypothetical protein